MKQLLYCLLALSFVLIVTASDTYDPVEPVEEPPEFEECGQLADYTDQRLGQLEDWIYETLNDFCLEDVEPVRVDIKADKVISPVTDHVKDSTLFIRLDKDTSATESRILLGYDYAETCMELHKVYNEWRGHEGCVSIDRVTLNLELFQAVDFPVCEEFGYKPRNMDWQIHLDAAELNVPTKLNGHSSTTWECLRPNQDGTCPRNFYAHVPRTCDLTNGRVRSETLQLDDSMGPQYSPSWHGGQRKQWDIVDSVSLFEGDNSVVSWDVTDAFANLGDEDCHDYELPLGFMIVRGTDHQKFNMERYSVEFNPCRSRTPPYLEFEFCNSVCLDSDTGVPDRCLSD